MLKKAVTAASKESTMSVEILKISGKKKGRFMDTGKSLLPEGGNLDMCLTCGTCASGCPATGLEGLDPRKVLRMAAFGMDEELLASDWPWMGTVCQRCIFVCPMKIDIPQLVFNLRNSRPRELRPKGILGSSDMALRNDTRSAIGATEEDWRFVVEDVAEEVRNDQPDFADLPAPMDKEGAYFYLNQNSWEPVTGPDEMIPLWKILNEVEEEYTSGRTSRKLVFSI